MTWVVLHLTNEEAEGTEQKGLRVTLLPSLGENEEFRTRALSRGAPPIFLIFLHFFFSRARERESTGWEEAEEEGQAPSH